MNLQHDQTSERWVVFIGCVSPREGDKDGDLTGDRVLLFLSPIFLGWKSFEVKIKPEIDLQLRLVILQPTSKLISV